VKGGAIIFPPCGTGNAAGRCAILLPILFGGRSTLPSIGFPELLLILFIALLIFGPRKLPELGSALGRTIKEFRKGVKEATEPSPEEKK
jgi:sec-independent protein translocase protein TatA